MPLIESSKFKVTNQVAELLACAKGIETLYSSHMFEHLSREGAEFFLKDALRVLETDGILRISSIS